MIRKNGVQFLEIQLFIFCLYIVNGKVLECIQYYTLSKSIKFFLQPPVFTHRKYITNPEKVFYSHTSIVKRFEKNFIAPHSQSSSKSVICHTIPIRLAALCTPYVLLMYSLCTPYILLIFFAHTVIYVFLCQAYVNKYLKLPCFRNIASSPPCARYSDYRFKRSFLWIRRSSWTQS